ncbi:GNAT family N-acetyltransferase/peptidase C39 family protein [Aliiglaciecola litoralis]|uniref:GNAT family N-acetyltransferase/peptidase C39 family protein n=1 Tax=Aliiglaciecola litoralis TaxID=582857 RepID=A0ABP3WS88_9ALTE
MSQAQLKHKAQPIVRLANADDLASLVELEQACFSTDRLSTRSFKHYLKSAKSVMLVAVQDGKLLGYGLILIRKGTRLARLYSIAVAAHARGLGVGKLLLIELEQQAMQHDKLFMRLEVACNNQVGIALYNSMGYRSFGIYEKYYDNDLDALRMQKSLRQTTDHGPFEAYPWYHQTTEFTCGPSSLLMAMNNLDPEISMNQANELDIWRQATTIFMTSGHGGCHPVGLAIAANKFGFDAKVVINTNDTLFLDGVRSEHKKTIIKAVDSHFKYTAQNLGIEIDIKDPDLNELRAQIEQGASLLCLISTYRLDGKKVPHWVAVTHIDQDCLYFHDPDPDTPNTESSQTHSSDAQHVPLALEDFAKMSAFGKNKLRTVVLIKRR